MRDDGIDVELGILIGPGDGLGGVDERLQGLNAFVGAFLVVEVRDEVIVVCRLHAIMRDPLDGGDGCVATCQGRCLDAGEVPRLVGVDLAEGGLEACLIGLDGIGMD